MMAMTDAVLHAAMMRVRELSLRLEVRTERDALAMTCGSLMLLFVRERGIKGAEAIAQRLLKHLEGDGELRKELREATEKLLTLLKEP